jgi:hypothetical protein
LSRAVLYIAIIFAGVLSGTILGSTGAVAQVSGSAASGSAASGSPASGSPELRLVRQIPLAATDFSVDNLGNLYVITPDNQLKKFTSSGDSVGAFNEVRRFGSLSEIDVSNPLKVLLFYKDFMTVLALDNQLGRIFKVDLRQAQILQASTIALSYDNNFWVFDEQNAQLKKMGDQGQAVMTSNDFRQLFGEAVMPTEIVDQDGMVYLNDPENGIYMFDYYGGFKVKLSFKGVSGLRVFNKNIFGIMENELFSYRPGTLQELHLKLPFSAKDADRIQIVFNGLYVLKGGQLSYYEIK